MEKSSRDQRQIPSFPSNRQQKRRIDRRLEALHQSLVHWFKSEICCLTVDQQIETNGRMMERKDGPSIHPPPNSRKQRKRHAADKSMEDVLFSWKRQRLTPPPQETRKPRVAVEVINRLIAQENSIIRPSIPLSNIHWLATNKQELTGKRQPIDV